MSLRTQQNMPPRPTHVTQPSDSSYSGMNQYRNGGGGGGGPLSNSTSSPYSQQQQQPPQQSSQSPSIPATSSSPSNSSSQKPPPVTLEQSRQIARTHFFALQRWLRSEDALQSSSMRANAREKLTRLTRQQFQELSTDVYDELVRRIGDGQGNGAAEQPFLAVRADFHPKRNQARQKLATLPLQRFRDLASDVYFELERRYPEFSEEDDHVDMGDGAQGDNQVRSPSERDAPPTRNSLNYGNTNNNSSSQTPNSSNNDFTSPKSQLSSGDDHSSSRLPPALGGGGGGLSSSASASRRIPLPGGGGGNDVVVPNKSTFVVEESGPPLGSSNPSNNINNNNNRQSSGSYHDVSPNNQSRHGQLGNSTGGLGHSKKSSVGSDSAYGGTKTNSYGQPLGRHDEYEEIQHASGAGAPGGGGVAPGAGQGGGGGPRGEPGGGGSGLGASGGLRGMNTQSRASETSSIGTRFIGNYAQSAGGSEAGWRASWEQDDVEKIKADYEYKLTMAQNRAAELQRDNEDLHRALDSQQSDSSRIRELEAQISSHKDRYDDQSQMLKNLRGDLESLQSARSRDISSSSSNPDTARLRADVDRLQRERRDADELANELRNEVTSLVEELRSVNGRYEEAVESRQGDERKLEELEEEARSWRRKYEQAKTELRSIKATSQMFSGSIKAVDGDYMPASNDGLISDVNVTAFQTSIDDLLQAARAKETSSTLTAMRAVVAAVDKIDRDVQAVDSRRLHDLPTADQDRLPAVKANTNATLSNLMTASKNHATSFGVSPVSLVDAAASHLSSSVIDLVRILKIRKTAPTKGTQPAEPIREEEDDGDLPPVPPNKLNGYPDSGSNARSPPSYGNNNALSNSSNDYLNSKPSTSRTTSHREREEQQQQQQQQQQRDDDRYRRGAPSPTAYSQGSSYGGYGGQMGSPRNAHTPEARSIYEDRYPSGGNGPPSQYGSSAFMSPNAQEEHPADTLDKLRNYLETQTEAIVHSIQSLLGAIRGGAQAEELNENLTEIITIVSSIVAISKDALPDESRADGEVILRELTDNCDKLSDMSQQSPSTVFDRQTKQAMASASFGVAKSLKSLNALLDNHSDSTA